MKRRNSRPKKRLSASSLYVLYEDRDIIIVDKPSGILSVPIEGSAASSAYSLLNDKLEDKRARVYIVHRIDRFTSGVLLFAKNPQARAKLIEDFLAHTPVRRYLALVSGAIREDEGKLVHHMKLTAKSFRQEVRSSPFPGSSQAVLFYKVLEKFSSASLVEIELETGLKNQIRAQFAAIDHPLLGEQQYAPPRRVLGDKLDHYALVAHYLEFKHPRTGRSIMVEAKIPPLLREVLHKLRRKGAPINKS